MTDTLIFLSCLILTVTSMLAIYIVVDEIGREKRRRRRHY